MHVYITKPVFFCFSVVCFQPQMISVKTIRLIDVKKRRLIEHREFPDLRQLI